MLIYWILFLWPALVALTSGRLETPASKRAFWSLELILILIIGLRYKVGPDWDNYLMHLDTEAASTWHEAILTSDPAYWLLNWVANVTDYGIWLVDLVCDVVEQAIVASPTNAARATIKI